MTEAEFRTAMVLMMGALVEQVRDMGAYWAHGPYAEHKREIPDLLRDELRAQVPGAAEVLDEAVLVDPKTLPKKRS